MLLKTKLQLIPLMLMLLILPSGCGIFGGVGDSTDPKAKQFVDAFFKEKFFEQIDSERSNYEKLVRELRSNGLEKDNLRRAYADTRIAYNAVLDLMRDDINAVRNIVGFATFDAETRYYDDLQRARKTGSLFYELAEKELDDGVLRDPGFVAFLLLEVYPLIKKVHDSSLEYCKRRMTVRIQQSRFKSWAEL